jgi:cyclase
MGTQSEDLAVTTQGLLYTVALALSPRLALATAMPADSIERITIAEGIHVFRAPSSIDVWTSSNTLVIVNATDVTVFDNSARPSTSRAIIAEIRKLTSKPVRTLINSHWHMDHWLGNEEYAKAYPGLQIVATTETRGYMSRLPMAYFVNSAGVARRRARLDTAIATGKLSDGSPLTPQARKDAEDDIAQSMLLDAELRTAKQVLPTLAFSDSLVFWSGDREFRLFSATGDASGSAVLYLPRERILATGDVLVRAEDGRGAQPWTTNSYKIAPWLVSLRQMEALDLAVIVPGQGAPLYDKTFLRHTVALYDAIITQVRVALERGAFRLDQVQAAMNLGAIRSQFTGNDPALNTRFDAVTAGLIRKAYQEARDGIATP